MLDFFNAFDIAFLKAFLTFAVCVIMLSLYITLKMDMTQIKRDLERVKNKLKK